MKIAFASTIEGLPWGGSEELWFRAASLFLRDGCEIIAETNEAQARSPHLRKLAAGGASIIPRRSPTFMRRIARRLGLPNPTPGWQRRKPDLLVISQGHSLGGIDYMRAARQSRIPYVIVVQMAAERWWPHDELAAELRTLYLAAEACCFVSEANLELVQVQLASSLPNARVVRNPFKVPYDVELKWPDDTGALRLAIVARVDCADKGHDLLLQVLDRQRWRNRSVEVSVFGEGPNRRALEAWCEGRGLCNVRFRGHCDDVVSIWREHHALALPSRLEGLPLAIVEAMLCHRPCIVTNVAGNAELIADNETGFVAPFPTVDALDEALERFWSQRSAWEEIGRRAGAAVRAQVPPDPASDFAAMLEELADRTIAE